MNIVAFLAVGLIAGYLSGKVVEGHGLGVFGDILVGMVGAIVGGVFFTSTEYHSSNFLASTLTATLGAIVLLVIVNLISFTFAPRKKFTHL